MMDKLILYQSGLEATLSNEELVSAGVEIAEGDSAYGAPHREIAYHHIDEEYLLITPERTPSDTYEGILLSELPSPERFQHHIYHAATMAHNHASLTQPPADDLTPVSMPGIEIGVALDRMEATPYILTEYIDGEKFERYEQIFGDGSDTPPEDSGFEDTVQETYHAWNETGARLAQTGEIVYVEQRDDRDMLKTDDGLCYLYFGHYVPGITESQLHDSPATHSAIAAAEKRGLKIDTTDPWIQLADPATYALLTANSPPR